MHETIEQKVTTILGHMSKTDLSKALEIGRPSLYSLIKSNNWKKYQMTIIDFIYKEICKITGDIVNISFEDETVLIKVKKNATIKRVDFETNIIDLY